MAELLDYLHANVDPTVEAAMKLCGVWHIAQPLMLYERCGRVSLCNFQSLGSIYAASTGTICFNRDPAAYVDKLCDMDALVKDDQRVLKDLTAVGRDNLVHALFEAVQACKPVVGGIVGASGAGGTFGDDLVDAIKGHKSSTVRREGVLAILSSANKAGLEVSPDEGMQPGKEVLGLCKDCLTPKASTGAGAVQAPISVPVVQLSKVDTGSGGKFFPEKGDPTAPQAAAAYKAFLYGMLYIAHDVHNPPELSAYAPGEATVYVPDGGHMLIDEASVKAHLAPLSSALAHTKVSGPALVTVLEWVSKAVRQLVVGGGGKYQPKLSPSAALRSVIREMSMRLTTAAEASAAPPGGGGDTRSVGEKALAAEAKRAAKAARKGKGGGPPGGGGGAGKGKGGASKVACRDFFVRGNCEYGTQCKFSHTAAAVAAAAVAPVMPAAPAQWGFPQQGWMYPPPQPMLPGPRPPPGPPPARQP